MYEIDEKKAMIDFLVVKIRQMIRANGFMSFYDATLYYDKSNNSSFASFLARNEIDEKEVVKRISCADIFRVQYKKSTWGKDSNSENLWYFDPDRETHLIEEISGIGPDDGC